MSMTAPRLDLDELCVTTMRTLAIDAIQQANSGHPGTPMGMSPTVYCLWQRLLRFDPADPIWMNRDRFVLSAGHASTMLYTVLHLARVKAVDPEYEILGRPSVTLDDLKTFRQSGSRCAGHPEYRWTSGVETTTGPLGQGVATSVGMAIAEKWLASRYNRPGFEQFGYRIYALCGDGCMMEGLSGEAASLAGHLKLDNLCWIYDNNHITIEGKTEITFTEDVAGRFLAYGWNVVRVGDANDLDRIENALRTAAGTTGRPSLVIIDSHIGYGSPHRQDTSAAHGEPLGEEEIKLTKQAYGWPADAKFLVPEEAYEHFESGIGRRGREARQQWEQQFADLLAAEITARTERDPGEHYRELTAEFGIPYYTRIDAPASPDEKASLQKLSPEALRESELAGEPILARLTRAPGNQAPIGGLKVVAKSGWFAARPSGTENIYKIYAESFESQAHLHAIVREAQEIVTNALRSAETVSREGSR
jgi:transketolase